MFSASKTYEKQLRIEKTRLSHQVWSHGGSTFKIKRTLNSHFSRPAETDPYGLTQTSLEKHQKVRAWENPSIENPSVEKTPKNVRERRGGGRLVTMETFPLSNLELLATTFSIPIIPDLHNFL